MRYFVECTVSRRQKWEKCRIIDDHLSRNLFDGRTSKLDQTCGQISYLFNSSYDGSNESLIFSRFLITYQPSLWNLIHHGWGFFCVWVCAMSCDVSCLSAIKIVHLMRGESWKHYDKCMEGKSQHGGSCFPHVMLAPHQLSQDVIESLKNKKLSGFWQKFDQQKNFKKRLPGEL